MYFKSLLVMQKKKNVLKKNGSQIIHFFASKMQVCGLANIK